MAFRLAKDPTDSHADYLPLSSLAVTVGTMIELDLGAATWTLANASTQFWQRKAVAIETVTTSATEVKAIIVNELQEWDVDLDNNSNSAHNGDRMLLSATAGQVNNTGTDDATEDACFVQRVEVGAVGDQRCLGHFVGGSGVNPDAGA